MEEKVALVESHRSTYGLNRCLKALSLSKGTWHYRQHGPNHRAKDEALKGRVISVIEDNLAYGYRRIERELEERTPGERVITSASGGCSRAMSWG